MIFGKKKAEYEAREQVMLLEIERLKAECAKDILGRKQISEELEQERKENENLRSEFGELRTKYAELQVDNERVCARCGELQQDNDRVYAGHRGLEEEINFLKYRISTLDELHESVAFRYWPHDGSYKDYTCRYPFERIEILPRGEVYTCCSGYIKHNYYIGNIYEEHESFEEIWNSDKAKKLRYSVQEGNFEFCQKICRFFHMPASKDNPIVPKNKTNIYQSWEKYAVNTTPKYIMLSCDESCNLHCPSCRSSVRAMNREESDRLFNRLMEVVRPMLNDCELLSALGTGELFASKALSRFFSTLTANEFPKLSLNLTTNLQLLNKEKWDEFANLLDFHKVMRVSVDAASKETYEKNRLGGTWEKLQENLSYLCKLRNTPEAHVDWIGLNFVVQGNNYHEMEDFVAMAKNLGVDAVEFQRLGNWGTFSEQEYKSNDVLDHNNPRYAEVINILKEIMKKDNGRLEIIQNVL